MIVKCSLHRSELASPSHLPPTPSQFIVKLGGNKVDEKHRFKEYIVEYFSFPILWIVIQTYDVNDRSCWKSLKYVSSFELYKFSVILLVDMWFSVSVSLGFFDDIMIPADALQHPSRLYPFCTGESLTTWRKIKLLRKSFLKLIYHETRFSFNKNNRNKNDNPGKRLSYIMKWIIRGATMWPTRT